MVDAIIQGAYTSAHTLSSFSALSLGKLKKALRMLIQERYG